MLHTGGFPENTVDILHGLLNRPQWISKLVIIDRVGDCGETYLNEKARRVPYIDRDQLIY